MQIRFAKAMAILGHWVPGSLGGRRVTKLARRLWDSEMDSFSIAVLCDLPARRRLDETTVRNLVEGLAHRSGVPRREALESVLTCPLLPAHVRRKGMRLRKAASESDGAGEMIDAVNANRENVSITARHPVFPLIVEAIGDSFMELAAGDQMKAVVHHEELGPLDVYVVARQSQATEVLVCG